MFGSTYQAGIAGDSFGFAGYNHPTRWGSFSVGTIYYNAGSIELNLSSGLRERRTAEEDILGLAGYALRVFPGLWVGGVGKWMRLELAEEARTKVYAADVGVLLRPSSWVSGLSLGASLQNLGSGVRFEQEADPLPKTLRAGAAYDLSFRDRWVWKDKQEYRLLFLADGVQVKNENFGANLGLELGILSPDIGLDFSVLRLGYRPDRTLDSFTIGTGFAFQRYQLDYAFHPMKNLGSTHQISFGLRF